MAKVIDKDQVGALWSISNLSLAFGLDRRTISKRLANTPHADLHKSSPVYALRAAAQALLNTSGGMSDSHDPDNMEPGDRLSWFKSERERLLFEQEVRQLVLDAEHRAELALVIKTVVLMLETLPDILERDCGLPPKAVAEVEVRVDAVRNDLAQKLIEATQDEPD